MTDKRECVVIVGGGLMGSGIAARSLIAGNPTILVDKEKARVDKGLDMALECIRELSENGLASEEAVNSAGELLTGSEDMEAALTGARFVIEAAYENLELKQRLFYDMDRMLPPEVPIASNTSGLRITEIAAHTLYPERTLTTHFWFPAHLVPLVEVVMSDKTDEKLAERVKAELKGWGKTPVLVKRDLPGQLANRILQAVIREAVHIVEMGLASPEDVDTAVKMGMGIRFPAWGPLEHIDAVGLDLAVSVQNTVLPGISGSSHAALLLTELVNAGNVGYRTGVGIYDWSKKDMKALAERRNKFILEALKLL